MPEQRLFYLSPYRLASFRWEAGILHSEALFEASADGYQQFAAYLALHEKSLFALLSNAAEEGFQIESLPFLRGRNRKAMIKRKLGQLFFKAPLTASLSLGYEKSRRKNERVLLAALSNNEFFQPWLAVLHKAQVALSGVYSLPFLGSSLLEKLNIADERCLLLTVQDQSVRQSYFEQGKLHFSRLTPLQNPSIDGIAQAFASESDKLQQYLSTQRMIVSEQPMTVHLLAHANVCQAINARCTDTPDLHFNFLNLEQCAQKIGMNAEAADSHSETLFLHLLTARTPHPQFADDGQRHYYQLWQLRRALYGTGILVLCGALALAGKQSLDTWGVEQETEQLAMDASQARQRYTRIAQTFPSLPTDNETLHRVIDRYSALEKASATPSGLYLSISRALNASSAVQLDAIDWTLAPAHVAGGQPSASTTLSNTVGEASEIAEVRGTVQWAANATPRQILTAFNLFLDALKSDARLQLLVLQSPVDLESGKSLKGAETTVEQDTSHRFSIQIGRKLGS
jgi:hypothetical protein